ncbi:MAG: hypothetical protein QN157_01655 [Armatimonadota bacterium]|nr:hypothetical protein [Armatimonadota bacterium]
MSRRIWVGGVAALAVVAAVAVVVARRQTVAAPPRERDPGLAVVVALRVLEREPQTQLSREQIVRILPLLRALKDTPAHDVEAARVIARAIRDILTPAQRAALDEARRRLEARRRGQRPTGGTESGPLPGRPGIGPLSDEERAAFRARAFERMIQHLERRSR